MARIAIVGATGMVGRKFLDILSEKNFANCEYFLFASFRSAGKKVELLGKEYEIIELNDENIKKYPVDIALFSAGGDTSLEFAPKFVDAGAVVIDNSSAWRMHDDVPLVVPEVNSEDIAKNKGIIANPNCSTIQAVVALSPLHKKYKIKRIVYSTYQAVSGAGMSGHLDLENGIKGEEPQKFAYPIFNNCIPQIDVFSDDGYTKEEIKMIKETQKILHDSSIKITATTVRVPVFNSHSESINVEFEDPFDLDELKQLLADSKGIVLQDDIADNVYPMPLYATGSDDVFAGRIRRDNSVENGINMGVVADNIRKGAASNAVQIAEKLLETRG